MTKTMKLAVLAVAVVLVGAQVWADESLESAAAGAQLSMPSVSGLRAQAAKSNTQAPTQPSQSGQMMGLGDLLSRLGVPLKPGERAYNALGALFKKSGAPAQADVTGTFNGYVFESIYPDNGEQVSFTGQEAGAVSKRFEFEFGNSLSGISGLGMTPDNGDSGTSDAKFGWREVSVKFMNGCVLDGETEKLLVRKYGDYLVAEVGSEGSLLFGKPDWVGLFWRAGKQGK